MLNVAEMTGLKSPGDESAEVKVSSLTAENKRRLNSGLKRFKHFNCKQLIITESCKCGEKQRLDMIGNHIMKKGLRNRFGLHRLRCNLKMHPYSINISIQN